MKFSIYFDENDKQLGTYPLLVSEDAHQNIKRVIDTCLSYLLTFNKDETKTVAYDVGEEYVVHTKKVGEYHFEIKLSIYTGNGRTIWSEPRFIKLVE